MNEASEFPSLEISPDPSTPLYRQIAEAICQAVRAGRLRPGQRLPARGDLAQKLQTSPVTVGRGYEWLQGRGLVDQKRRSGTWLRSDALTILQSSTKPQQGDSRGRDNAGDARFSQIVVVLGEPDITYMKRDQVEILSQILTGVRDVLADRAGWFRYVQWFDSESLKDIPADAAILVFGKQPQGAYESPTVPALLHDLGERGIPVLGIWGHDQMSGLPQIQYSPYQAVNVACEHLLDCGYRRLGYIGDMGRELAPKFFEFTNVLFKAGLDFQFAHVREVGLRPGDAYQAALDLAHQDLPDAFFIDVDWKAMEVVSALTHAGVNVPGDVAIVGFGDVADVRYFTTDLTTVRLPRREIGQEAGRQLLAWATDRTPLRNVLLDAQMVVRKTTAPAVRTADSTNLQLETVAAISP